MCIFLHGSVSCVSSGHTGVRSIGNRGLQAKVATDKLHKTNKTKTESTHGANSLIKKTKVNTQVHAGYHNFIVIIVDADMCIFSSEKSGMKSRIEVTLSSLLNY